MSICSRLCAGMMVLSVSLALVGCNAGSGSVISGAQSSLIAGSFLSGNTDGASTAARFNNPANVAVDNANNIFVADYDNNLVRKIDPAGNVSTVFSNPNFVNPFGIAAGGGGIVYVETDQNDTGTRNSTSGTVWRINTNTSTGTVVARNLGRPRGIALLADGSKLVLSDVNHHTISLLSIAAGTVAVLAGTPDTKGFANGTGGAALFNRPYGVKLDNAGNIIVADANNNAIRKVTMAGVVTTIAGNGTPGFQDSSASSALFQAPQSVAVDGIGNIYVGDNGNFRIRKIDVSGSVFTVAGDGNPGYHEGNGGSIQLFGMEGMDIAADGRSLVIADGNQGTGAPFNRIRRINLP